MNDKTLEAQVIELEMRIAFQDQTIEALSTEVKTQQAQLELLTKKFESLRAFVTSADTTDTSQVKPPHY